MLSYGMKAIPVVLLFVSAAISFFFIYDYILPKLVWLSSQPFFRCDMRFAAGDLWLLCRDGGISLETLIQDMIYSTFPYAIGVGVLSLYYRAKFVMVSVTYYLVFAFLWFTH